MIFIIFPFKIAFNINPSKSLKTLNKLLLYIKYVKVILYYIINPEISAYFEARINKILYQEQLVIHDLLYGHEELLSHS